MKFVESASRVACRGLLWTVVAVCALAAACTKSPQPKCTSNADCKDPAYPFCDVGGQFAASNGEKNVCTIVPPDCPVATCGCTPGAARCSGDDLITCDPGGMSESTTTCALGCTGTTPQCAGFTPLNGLGPALANAGSAPDVDLQDGDTIDTSTGVITASGGGNVAVPAVVVARTNGMIQVFYAHSIHVGNVRVVGSLALALVAATDVTIDGKLDASAAGINSGPGALHRPYACAGGASTAGGGGGGNATAGGSVSGVAGSASGGALQGSLDSIDLVGGCNGGPEVDSSNIVIAEGGGGGGVVELVAGSTITVGASGVVSLGGGGAPTAGGGGAGGNAVFEAPKVTFSAGSKIVANGGAGGACSMTGEDAHLDATAALGPGPCGSPPSLANSAGNGATSAAGPGGGRNVGGGGGAVGRLYVRTRDGSVTDGGAFISAAQTTAMLTIQ